MLDHLHLFIPFKEEACTAYFWSTTKRRGKQVDELVSCVNLEALGVRMEAGNVERDKKGGYVLSELRHPWDNIPSSYTPLAFKVYHDGFGFRKQAGIELKASPAKLTQGHNLYGSTDIRTGGLAMFSFLLGIYPQLSEKLDFANAEVQSLDCTYSARLPNERSAQQALDALRSISNGQTKSRGDNYKETAYWGSKKGRIKKLKCYLKQYEYEHQRTELERLSFASSAKGRAAARTLAVMNQPHLIEWSKCLLRFEVTIKSRYLKRRGIPQTFKALCDYQKNLQQQNRCLIRELWKESTQEIFKACEGMTMTTIDDDKLRNALLEKFTRTTKRGKISTSYAKNLFNTYRNICAYGWEEAKSAIAISTFHKHIKDLITCGVSKAALQKMQDIKKNNVVPLIRFLEIDFSEQRPAWYVEPNLDQVMTDFDRFQEQEAANETLPPQHVAVGATVVPFNRSALPSSPHSFPYLRRDPPQSSCSFLNAGLSTARHGRTTEP